MDTAHFLYNCATLTLEVCASYLFYKLYREHADRLNSLKDARCLELDNDLKRNVEENNGVIKYAVISGKVQALSPPLRSQYIYNLNGVIREKITLERKVKWNPFLGIWGSANNELLQSVNSIPFALCSKSTGFFKKRISVEIVEPLSAKELIIPTIHDEFVCHNDTIGDAVFGVIRGEKLIGIQEIEKLLCENETLTAVGKLVVENNELKLKPPDEGLTYFLTPLSLETLVSKVRFKADVYKATTIVMGTLSLVLFLYLSKRAFCEMKQRVIRYRDRKRYEEQRKLRRKMAGKSHRIQDENVPKCIICLDSPVEILILECGHACLCFDCSEHIHNLCPVCRNPISRTVSAFWP